MWTILLPVIAQYGIPVAEKIWQLSTSGLAPVQSDWDALNALTKQKAKDIMTAQLVAAGIPLTDPHAIALLAQAS